MIACIIAIAANAQVTVEFGLGDIDDAFKTTIDDATVIDVATTASAIASPSVYMSNPLKDQEFSQVVIDFDLYNYGDQAVLGALFSFYDSSLGRLYFTNGSYLGFNASSEYFDANIYRSGTTNDAGTDIGYTQVNDYLGSASWKKVEITFTSSGFSVKVDDVLAYNEQSTDIDLNSTVTDYANVISFLQNATTLAIGTGSWWSDNTDTDGNYYDAQNSYMKNIYFTYSTDSETGIENSLAEGEIISTEYYDIKGTLIGSDFEALKTGIYIKKATFTSGSTKCTKIVKTEY